MPHIFILEDNASFLSELRRIMEFEGHEVTVAESISEAKTQLASKASFDLLILDWHLPDGSGLDLCRELRQAGETAAILVLTGKGRPSQLNETINSGADDYMTKPCRLNELRLRVGGLLKRAGRPWQSEEMIARNVTLVSSKMLAMVNGKLLDLTRKEFALLDFFMRNNGKVYSLEQLLDYLWSADDESAPDTVRTHIKNLRKKLDQAGAEIQIETVHALGYRLVE